MFEEVTETYLISQLEYNIPVLWLSIIFSIVVSENNKDSVSNGRW